MKLHPVIPNRVSHELWDKSIGKFNSDPSKYSLQTKEEFIHLIDSVSRGYASPMEAYEAIELGYVPGYLLVRPSAYRDNI